MEALKAYLKEVRNIPLLTPEEEIRLSKLVRSGDEQARKQMIRANLRLVINIAKKYMHLGIPLLDLIEEGNLGLMKAVDKFNPKMGFRFSTYAAWWIKQTITRSISEQGKLIRVPVYMNELIARWKKTKEELAQKLKRLPTDEEVAKKMRLSNFRKEQIKLWLSTTTSSIDSPVGEEGETEIGDLIKDEDAVSPDKELGLLLEKERVNQLFKELSPRERKVLTLRFGLKDGHPHTLAEIGKKLKVSRERIRQIEEETLKKLKSYIKEKGEKEI